MAKFNLKAILREPGLWCVEDLAAAVERITQYKRYLVSAHEIGMIPEDLSGFADAALDKLNATIRIKREQLGTR